MGVGIPLFAGVGQRARPWAGSLHETGYQWLCPPTGKHTFGCAVGNGEPAAIGIGGARILIFLGRVTGLGDGSLVDQAAGKIYTARSDCASVMRSVWGSGE